MKVAGTKSANWSLCRMLVLLLRPGRCLNLCPLSVRGGASTCAASVGGGLP